MASKYFDEIQKKISPKSEAFVSISLDIIDQIHHLLNEQGLSEMEFADKLGKSELEVEKWLTPGYNLTLKDLAEISVVLDNILETPLRSSGHYDFESNEAVTETKSSKVFSVRSPSRWSFEYENINLHFEESEANIVCA